MAAVENLPDLPALQQLARALYHNGSIRGAALLVGAGFSKNANLLTPDTPTPPDWWELLNELNKQLYPGTKSNPPTDALRIAEEYRAYFGQATLDGFIRTRFPDQAWLPGPLHHQALNFPWSEILTTNWDTLLERTADGITDVIHEVVRTDADLAHARSKRIIKLHGTLGDKDPLIFAAEDYRTYPLRHAAFVNVARQIFIENDLCLIGFSGNDPNFLEWAGWVRDNLGGNARRIFLVGHLNLKAPARRYLEARNIAPIDLAPLVNHLPVNERHSAATKLFFEALRDEKPREPHEWIQHELTDFPLRKSGPDLHDRARNDEAFAASALEETANLLQEDRGKYPGWLICPKDERQGLHYAGFDEWVLLKPPILARFEPARRAQILFEFLWRYTIGFERLRQPIYDALVAIMSDPTIHFDKAHRLEFALALMRNARIEANDGDLEKWGALIESETTPDDTALNEARYQRCLRLRDRFDLEGLAKAITTLSADDPLWRLRKAGLLAEVGAYVKANQLIKEATADLERAYRLNRNSIWLKSCLGWASWLARVSEMGNFRKRSELPRARDFKDVKVDPAGELEALQNSADTIRWKEQEDDAAVIPLFEPGSYRRGTPKQVAQPDSAGYGVWYELDQLMEVIGLPVRLDHIQIAAGTAISIAKVTYNHTFEWYVFLLRALHAHLDNPFIRYFGRVAIAQLPGDVASGLNKSLDAAISFWLERLKRSEGDDLRADRFVAVNELRLVLSAQSHLTVRMSVDEAMATFRRAVEIANNQTVTHRWLIEAAGDLAKYTLAAIPLVDQGALVLSAIEFPLASERGGHTPTWPDITREISGAKPSRDMHDPQWDKRIHELLNAAAPDRPSRPEAIERLAYLSVQGALKASEVENFAQALWAKVDDRPDPLPVDTNLLDSMYPQLPSPPGINATARATNRIVGRALSDAMNSAGASDTRLYADQQNQLISLYNMGPLGLVIPPDRAAELFDQILAWNPLPLDTNDPFGAGLRRQFNDGIRVRASDAITFAVAPAMHSADRNDVRLRNLLDFITRTQAWRAVAALPLFVSTAPYLVDGVTLAVHRGLSVADHIQVSGAASALIRWSNLVAKGVLGGMPRSLVEQLLAMIETRQENLHILLHAAVALIKDRMLTVNDMTRLMRSLADLYEETKYSGVPIDSRQAVTISLIRAQCVRTALVLKEKIMDDGTLAKWIDEGISDPLPEVRFAGQQAES